MGDGRVGSGVGRKAAVVTQPRAGEGGDLFEAETGGLMANIQVGEWVIGIEEEVIELEMSSRLE